MILLLGLLLVILQDILIYTTVDIGQKLSEWALVFLQANAVQLLLRLISQIFAGLQPCERFLFHNFFLRIIWEPIINEWSSVDEIFSHIIYYAFVQYLSI